MSRGRPRHQSSRRRMYSPRQRDLRERRIHQRSEDHQLAIEVGAVDADDAQEFESPTWGMGLTARAGAA
ncbi:MAG: hypothetical protein ACXWWU_07695 [Candidatus Limnocylindria bacterium]